MSEPATITSPHVPDVDDVRQLPEKMIKSLRFVELVVAIVAFITRMRDLNTELTRRVADLRRRRPKSETLGRVEGQLLLAFGVLIAVIEEPPEEEEEQQEDSTSGSAGPGEPPKKKARPRHPGRAALPKHLERVPEVNRVPADLRTCPRAARKCRPSPTRRARSSTFDRRSSSCASD
jgi:Transposase C of IS166 homeodomain